MDRLLGEHGIQRDNASGRGQFEGQMEARRLEQVDEGALKAFRRGWCLGGEAFRQQMLEQMEGKLGEHHSGELHRESAEARAERIMAEELGRLGWKPAELARRRKTDPRKLAIAARLREQTTLPLKEIAARVHLGTSKSANARLHHWMRQPESTGSAQVQLPI